VHFERDLCYLVLAKLIDSPKDSRLGIEFGIGKELLYFRNLADYPRGISKMAEGGLINYENPPVIEVVCGILFKPLEAFLAPHYGLLWEKYRPEYNNCSEVPPLAPIIEKLEVAPKINIEFDETPPLPRIWFTNKTDNGIIQVQRDRFLYNWRKIRPEDKYPRYYNVIMELQGHFNTFCSFIKDNNLGEIIPLQYEMTYVNHILKGEGWESIKDIGTIFPDFSFRSTNRKFLPEPEGINWRTSFALPKFLGRMHVAIRKGKIIKTNQPMLLLDLTVRGIGDDNDLEKMINWFDIAHEWIVYGFADLTGEEVQKGIWKRKDK
jgi:uncharacterized protein (TIGR04255 family)